MALTTDVQEKDCWECKPLRHIQGWPLSLRQLDKRAFGSISTEGYSCTPYILMRTHRTHTPSPPGTRRQGTCRGFLAQGALDMSGYLLALCSSLQSPTWPAALSLESPGSFDGGRWRG